LSREKYSILYAIQEVINARLLGLWEYFGQVLEKNEKAAGISSLKGD
jgi:hypothetical protein